VAGEVLSRGDRRRLARLVRAAERTSGLQIVLYVGATEADPAAHAERLLAGAGEPAVLVLVAPDSRRIEVRTAPAVRDRIPDAAAEDVIAAMRPGLVAGELTGAVKSGLAVLVAAAGPARPGGAAVELPEVLGP
jgi:uncharacterized membrane protein YgcG